MGIRDICGSKWKQLIYQKLAKDWLTSHVLREEYITLYYYYVYIMYTIGAMRICVESRRTRRSDCSINGICPIRFKKIKLDKLLSPRYVYIYTYILYYICTNISSDRIYTSFETQTEQPQPYKLDLWVYNITHARVCASVWTSVVFIFYYYYYYYGELKVWLPLHIILVLGPPVVRCIYICICIYIYVYARRKWRERRALMYRLQFVISL